MPAVGCLARQRAQCFDAFAILPSGESKTPTHAVERSTRSIANSAQNIKRSDQLDLGVHSPAAGHSLVCSGSQIGLRRGHIAHPAGSPTVPVQGRIARRDAVRVPATTACVPMTRIELAARTRDVKQGDPSASQTSAIGWSMKCGPLPSGLLPSCIPLKCGHRPRRDRSPAKARISRLAKWQ